MQADAPRRGLGLYGRLREALGRAPSVGEQRLAADMAALVGVRSGVIWLANIAGPEPLLDTDYDRNIDPRPPATVLTFKGVRE